MKGRRKVKTDKWVMKQQLIEEARSVLARRAARRAARREEAQPLFRAPPTTVEEPIGMLAGTRAVLPKSPTDGRKRNGRKLSHP